MSEYDSYKPVTVTVLMDAEFKERLKRLAIYHRRSLSNTALIYLEEMVCQEEVELKFPKNVEDGFGDIED